MLVVEVTEEEKTDAHREDILLGADMPASRGWPNSGGTDK